MHDGSETSNCVRFGDGGTDEKTEGGNGGSRVEDVCGARWLSGRMPDSQSSEPGFESLFVTVSEIGHFRSLHLRPCSLSCINEYLAIRPVKMTRSWVNPDILNNSKVFVLKSLCGSQMTPTKIIYVVVVVANITCC